MAVENGESATRRSKSIRNDVSASEKPIIIKSEHAKSDTLSVSIVILALFFATFLAGVWYTVTSLKPLPLTLVKEWSGTRPFLSVLGSPLPSDLRLLRATIEFHMTDNYWSVFSALCASYIFLQAFAIPGPAIIAIVMSALFGGWLGGFMSMACSLVGSSICYFLFKIIGGPILRKYFASRLNSLRAQISSHSDNLLFFFLFLRITPIVPNFFINISSGNLGIPYPIFLAGTVVGLIPNAVILGRVGVELATLQDENGTGLQFDWARASALIGVGLLALLPVLVKNKFKKKLG